MNYLELSEEVITELGLMAEVVGELASLHQDTSERKPTVREKAAAAIFMAQFYNGIENILKRLSYFYDVPLPTGESWHVELFKRFRLPGYPALPILFDNELASALAPYRNFRHVVFHSYCLQLDWSRMSEGVAHVESIFQEFKAKILAHLETIA